MTRPSGDLFETVFIALVALIRERMASGRARRMPKKTVKKIGALNAEVCLRFARRLSCMQANHALAHLDPTSRLGGFSAEEVPEKRSTERGNPAQNFKASQR
jgi:hypothetical protein